MKQNINLTIAGIPINIGVDTEDESFIRTAEILINSRVQSYKDQGYKEPESAYFLALSALTLTVRMLQNEEILNKIKNINTKVDEYISLT